MVDMSRGAMSGFLLSNKNTHSFMPGMSAEKDFLHQDRVDTAGKERPDDLGHRIQAGGMSDEEMAAFFKAHPERAVEMAKIATLFQGAGEKISAPA